LSDTSAKSRAKDNLDPYSNNSDVQKPNENTANSVENSLSQKRNIFITRLNPVTVKKMKLKREEKLKLMQEEKSYQETEFRVEFNTSSHKSLKCSLPNVAQKQRSLIKYKSFKTISPSKMKSPVQRKKVNKMNSISVEAKKQLLY
jgi:hypothetical protein